MPDSPRWFGYAMAIACVMIWSSFMLMSRLAGLSVLTPYDVLALRLICACAVLALLPRPASRIRITLPLWFATLLGVVAFPLLCYVAARSVPATHPALLAAGMQPFMLALLLGLTGKGWPRARCLPAYLLLTGGLLLLAIHSPAGKLQWQGDTMLLLAALSWVAYGQLSRQSGLDPWQLTRLMTHAGALLYLPVYLLFLPKQWYLADAATLLMQGLFHGIVPPILGMQCYLQASRQLAAGQLAGIMAWIPVVTGMAAFFLLNEQSDLLLWLALLSVSIGASWLSHPHPGLLRINHSARKTTCPM